ncbi:hypothetical protein C8A05DRAFT_33218 [Staphylotrichum tortipilum]|uniref:Peptide hydrolase n=1 Tax=Staphylotrichum tortipilum TaxID=2831512 RepID=A0AAN6RUY7_9PEZI|nr:hypothetical protein C8A05DRAFT_33218 [Staphylotrichum longicolle]
MKHPHSTLPLLLSLLTLPSPSLTYTPLSDFSLQHHLTPSLPTTSSNITTRDPDFDPLIGALLAPILRPRVPGSVGHAAVQSHFVHFAQTELHPAWQIEWHNTTATTPATGARQVPFRNLVLRRDPPGAAAGEVARLTLAAHYDSLLRPEGFVGAVDSAVPCAVLMFVARAVDGVLGRLWGDGGGEGGLEVRKGVQVLLLDGEEAWVEWSERDSLYGSRALAETWEDTRYEAGSSFSTPLEAISLFVLLDLLGAPEPNIPSYFPTTHWAYRKVARIEERMRKLGLLETRPKKPFLTESEKKEGARFFGGYVQDDHVPFMQRGVDILHVIPSPFPPVWHTMDDDGAHLDLPTIRDWARIMTAFVAEWMDLEGYLEEGRGEAEGGDSGRDEL